MNEMIQDGFLIREYESGAVERIAIAEPDMSERRSAAVAGVKAEAARRIAALAWRTERARERELLQLGGETLGEVLAAREAIRRASNRLEAAIMAAADPVELDGLVFDVLPEDAAPVRLSTRREFLARLAAPEMEAILTAAKTDTAIEILLLRWETAERINIDSPATAAALAALETAGLLAAGRAAEILA